MALMEFSIEKSELFKELYYVQGAVEKKAMVPILSNILLQATNNTLTVTATDLDVTVQSTCAAKVKETGALAVPARKLFDIVRFLPEADIHFKSDGETVNGKNWIKVKCERSRFRLASLSKDNFPEIPSSQINPISLPAKALHYMSKSCIFAISNEDSRYSLNGALMVLKPESITLISTDGHRLVFISSTVKIPELDKERKILIPKKALTELVKLTDQDAPNIEFRSSENHLFFRAGERLLVSRIMAGQFPNYDMVIPKDNDKHVILNTDEFTDALKRVFIMTDKESHSVLLSVKNNQLVIKSGGEDSGEAKESLSAAYKGEEVEVKFNAKYLLDFLSGLESEKVELELRDKETQGLFKPSPKGDYLHQYVVMPMQV